MVLVLFGDPYGLPLLLRHTPEGAVAAVVAAAIRPGQHEELRNVADAARVPLLIHPKRTDPAYPSFAAAISAISPDFILVHSYSMKLHVDILLLPRVAAVNVHGALLPQYRGPNPIQWAIINGETEAGVTMHHMTEEIDGGDVISQRRVPILFGDTWRDVQARIEAATGGMFADDLPRVLAGTAPRVPQDASRARTWPRRTPGDGAIDWDKPAVEIYNLVRALVRPLPGAFYYHEGRKVVLDEYLAIGEIEALRERFGSGASRARRGAFPP